MTTLINLSPLLLITFIFWFAPSNALLERAIERVKHLRWLRFTSPGDELQEQISLIEAASVLANQALVDRLAQYKFFTPLVVTLLDHSRKFGATITMALKELRQGLGRDLASERQIKGVQNAGLWQFGIVSAVTWIFILMAHLIAGISSSLFVLVLIAGLQLMGLAIFVSITGPLRRYYFNDLEFFLSSQYCFKSLVATGISAQLMMKRAHLDELFERSFKKELSLLQRRLKLLITRWKQTGSAVASDWDDALSETWSLHQLFYARYLKALEALKFALLALFFLSSYFIFIGSLFVGFFGA